MDINRWAIIIISIFSFLVAFFKPDIKKYSWLKVLKAYLSVIVFVLIGFLMSEESLLAIDIIIIIFLFFVIVRNLIAFLRSYQLSDTKENVHIGIANIMQIIIVFATLYHLIYSYFPDSFRVIEATTHVEQYFDFLYFSTITFTTIGYGDIVPIHFLAKGLVMLEAILFFVFITIAITFIGKNILNYKDENRSDSMSIINWRKRLLQVDVILYRWMRKEKINGTTPENCISILRENDLYMGKREDALSLRNDLRLLKERKKLPFTINYITIDQDEKGKWHIYKTNAFVRYLKHIFALS